MIKFQIWYMRPEFFQDGIVGMLPDLDDLPTTHIHLKDLDLEDGAQLERVYNHMQAEVWSPNGEARELIASKGLMHTSMAVGDVIVDQQGGVFAVAGIGFTELAR